MCAHVLVAEDDEKQAELIRLYLVREGHDVTVVHDGRAVIGEVSRRPPDLVVLDWMLPGLDGLEVCRRIRAEGDLPVLMLTARSTEDDVLLGLDLGADDYMTKPYRPRELVARIRTLLRRTRHSDHARHPVRPVLEVGPLAVDPAGHEVFIHGRPVRCTPGEFRILSAMAASPGRVFTRAQLLELTTGYDRVTTERAVDVHIMNLRKKVEISPRDPALLLTVHGIGYKLASGHRGN
ncbi:response regulator transcription factor [Streptomyces sp. NPDC004976]